MGLLKEDPPQVRLGCLTLAVQMGSSDPENCIKAAKSLEAYCWGGFGPIDKPPHPVSGIEDEAKLVIQQISDLAQNSADLRRQKALREVIPHFERFMAELRQAWGEELP